MKKQGKKQQPGEAIGLDLSDRTGQYCHLDADGEILAEGKVTLTEAGLKRAFGHCHGPAWPSKQARSAGG